MYAAQAFYMNWKVAVAFMFGTLMAYGFPLRRFQISPWIVQHWLQNPRKNWEQGWIRQLR
jgi:hypothetical protein